MTIQGC